MNAQILITGATGFIGRHLTRDLLASGSTVRALVHSAERARGLFGDRVEIVLGDLGDPGSLQKACEGIDTVYHIGGLFKFGLRHSRKIYQANIDGAENLFQAASKAKVSKVVHVSSASVLSRAATTANPYPLLNETDFSATAPRFSPYKFSKWESENRALAWSKRGLPVVIASLSCPIGCGDEAPTPTGQIVRDFLQGRFPCYSKVGLNFANVTDVISGLKLTAEFGRVGERYLLTNENLWLKDFLDCLAEETDLPAPTVCLPQWSVEAISYFGEMFDLLNVRSNCARICIETALQARSTQFFDHSKARKELGWTPSPIQAGIQQAVEWFTAESRFESTCDALPVAKSHAR